MSGLDQKPVATRTTRSLSSPHTKAHLFCAWLKDEVDTGHLGQFAVPGADLAAPRRCDPPLRADGPARPDPDRDRHGAPRARAARSGGHQHQRPLGRPDGPALPRGGDRPAGAHGRRGPGRRGDDPGGRGGTRRGAEPGHRAPAARPALAGGGARTGGRPGPDGARPGDPAVRRSGRRVALRGRDRRLGAGRPQPQLAGIGAGPDGAGRPARLARARRAPADRRQRRQPGRAGRVPARRRPRRPEPAAADDRAAGRGWRHGDRGSALHRQRRPGPRGRPRPGRDRPALPLRQLRLPGGRDRSAGAARGGRAAGARAGP